jgi:hypothetical protein
MMTVYFIHDTLTPGNVRRSWDNPIGIPHVGDTVTGEMGYMGARVVWTVARVEWIDGNDGQSVTCYMTGPTGEPE